MTLYPTDYIDYRFDERLIDDEDDFFDLDEIPLPEAIPPAPGVELVF